MSSYDNNRHSVNLTDIPGRPGTRKVYIDGCETAREAIEIAERMYGGKASGAGACGSVTPRRSSSSSSGGSALGGLLLLLIPVGLIGAVVGGGSGEPTYTPSSPAPVTRSYQAPTSTPTPAWDNGPCVTANFEPC